MGKLNEVILVKLVSNFRYETYNFIFLPLVKYSKLSLKQLKKINYLFHIYIIKVNYAAIKNYFNCFLTINSYYIQFRFDKLMKIFEYFPLTNHFIRFIVQKKKKLIFVLICNHCQK